MADLGDTLTFKADLYDKPADQGGVLSNASAAVLTVTLPDGTTTTPTVTNPTTGKYTANYVPAQSGRFVGTWLFTMGGGSTTSYVETFDVGASLVTVDEAIAHLRAAGVITTTPDLEQLQWLCFVATDAVERDLGRVLVRRSVTETYNGGASIVLNSTPVVSVTSISESGYPLTDYILNAGAGILYRGTSYYPQAFARGMQNVTVTYVAGYTDPPRIARKVALNAVQGMWSQSQQAPHPLLDDVGAAVFAAQGALTSIEQSAYDSLRAPGIA